MFDYKAKLNRRIQLNEFFDRYISPNSGTEALLEFEVHRHPCSRYLLIRGQARLLTILRVGVGGSRLPLQGGIAPHGLHGHLLLLLNSEEVRSARGRGRGRGRWG